jgi:hypothetical protein
MKIRPSIYFYVANVLLLVSLLTSTLHAQNSAASPLPEAPNSLQTVDADSGSPPLDSSSSLHEAQSPPPTSASTNQAQQTKRILGVIPNFRSVSANVYLPPQSVKDKFHTATQDSFDYSAVLLPAVVAGYSQATNSTPEFHQGAAAYGRYFWHSFVDQTSENYFVEFIVPSITHQDNRYYTLGSGGFWKRSRYALTRAVITRNDAGHNTFNTSEVVGAGAAAGISNLYYPSRERSFANTADKWGLNVGIDAATFVFKEFWPDINRGLFHGE